MNFRREHRAYRSALLDDIDDIEEGGIRESLSSSTRELDHRANDNALDSLKERVTFLKRLTGDIHEEVLSHNRMLDKTGSSMDASRGVMSGSMDRFKKVFERKSNKKCLTIAYVIVAILALFYIFRLVRLL